jgi:molecular chaperone DnaJ
MADFYDILGVSKTATQDEIKKAYRKQAHKFHPDKNQGDKTAESKFKEVNNAYEVLSDQQKRANYDRFGSTNGANGFPGGAGGFGGFDVNFGQGGPGAGSPFDDLNDVFETFFGSGFSSTGRRRNSQTRTSRGRGIDIEMKIDLTLEEAAAGAKKNFTYTHKVKCNNCTGKGHEPGSKIDTCPTCKGKGRVYQRVETIFGVIQQETTCPTCDGTGNVYEKKCAICTGKGYNEESETLEVSIPVGVDNHDKVRVSGKGEAGYRGSEAGDLFLIVNIVEHKNLIREGLNITSTIEVDYFDLLLGTKVDVDTVWGEVEVAIPRNTNPEGKLRLKEQGMPKLNNPAVKGDHYIKIKVVMPKKLNNKQLKALEDIRDTLK